MLHPSQTDPSLINVGDADRPVPDIGLSLGNNEVLLSVPDSEGDTERSSTSEN
jgi:hypothetical protein